MSGAKGVGALTGHVENFNSGVRTLVRDLARRYPGDAKVHRVQRRAALALGVDPHALIGVIGPHLYRYREQVYALLGGGGEAEAFFFEKDYDAEMRGADDAESVDLAAYIISRVKECGRELPPEEKEQYKGVVVDLLDEYIEYLAILRRLD